MKTTEQENLIRQYLLGDLPEAEALALEQKYFNDAEKFDQIWAMEDVLVDAYVRDQLPAADRALFEKNYLATEKHRDRVANARFFLAEADASFPVEPTVSPRPENSQSLWWQNLKAVFSPQQLAFGGVLAMFLLTFGGWLYFRSHKASPKQIAEVKTSPSIVSLATPVPSIPMPSMPTPTPQSKTSPPSSSPSAPPSILAFTLIGAGVRDSGNVQQLVIPNGTKQVRLQMKLDDQEFSRFQVKLRKIDGAEIFSQSSLLPTANKKSVSAVIPTAKLSSGDYVVTLEGIKTTSEQEEINKFFFRVTKK